MREHKYKNSYYIPEVRVYGPYLIRTGRTKGRKQVSLIYPCGRKRTIMYARFLMECHLQKELDPEETVDHKDNDKTNDILENLQILSRRENALKDVIKVKKIEIICVLCGTKAFKKPNYLDWNSRLGRAGPFCGKSCSGKYSAGVQNNKMKKLPVQNRYPRSKRTYYKEYEQ